MSNCFRQVDLHTFTFKYVQRWICLLAERKHHLDLSFGLIMKLLSSSDLDISSEMELINFADSWIKYDTAKRSKFAIQLIKEIRLPLLSNAALESLLSDDISFSKCDDSNKYIRSAISNKLVGYDAPKSIEYENRYCSQKNYDIIFGGTTGSNSYTMYKLENRNISEETKFETSLKNYYSTNSVFINDVVYVFLR